MGFFDSCEKRVVFITKIYESLNLIQLFFHKKNLIYDRIYSNKFEYMNT